jgi:ubiquinone/menaquinone biosynthesis C-methylase UbiE
MLQQLKIISSKHTSIKRDYLARVNNLNFPKWKAAELAKKWDFDYWDGSRDVNYGGYLYKEGFWTPVAKKIIEVYKLNSSSRVLDIGCGKGFLLFELSKLLPGIRIEGIDISEYAVNNSHPEIFPFIKLGNATHLPWNTDFFDLAFSINTFHNLYTFELEKALIEISRVSKNQFICVESYRNEKEKANLLYWQVTCEAFYTPIEWSWWFSKYKYRGDYEFIYFQ